VVVVIVKHLVADIGPRSFKYLHFDCVSCLVFVPSLGDSLASFDLGQEFYGSEGLESRDMGQLTDSRVFLALANWKL
jgi:hypothetical protein